MTVSAVDAEATRPQFEAEMRRERVENFTRRPSGRYDNMVLEWHWLGWCMRVRAEHAAVAVCAASSAPCGSCSGKGGQYDVTGKWWLKCVRCDGKKVEPRLQVAHAA